MLKEGREDLCGLTFRDQIFSKARRNSRAKLYVSRQPGQTLAEKDFRVAFPHKLWDTCVALTQEFSWANPN